MKKFLVASLVICSFSLSGGFVHNTFAANSSDPIEVHPARTQLNIPVGNPSAVETPPATKADNAKVGQKTEVKKGTDKKSKSSKKHKKHKKVAPKKIVINYSEINTQLENGDYVGADYTIAVALKQNPKDEKAKALAVVSLVKKGQLETAQNQINLLLKQYPKNSDLHYAQGVIFYKKTASSDMTNITNTPKLLSDALSEFKSAIQLDSKNAKAYNAAGVISLTIGQMQQAKDYFSKAYAIDKNYSIALDNIGTIDFTEGRYSDAQKKFNQAISINPKNSTAYYHLAQISSVNQDFSKALSYLDKAIALNPSSHAFYNLQGECYQNQGNEAAAINSYKKSISLKPEFVQAYLNLAEIYELRSDNELALGQLKTAIAIKPDFYDAKLKIADITLSNGKYDSAISYYNSLLCLDDYKARALKGIANAYYAKAQISSSRAFIGSNKDLFEALDNINKAIASDGDDLELHLAKLKLAKITGQDALSQQVLGDIVKSESDDLISKVVKGEAYLSMDDYVNAKIAFDSAVAACRTLQEELYLAEIFIYHKQYKSAKDLLTLILKKDVNNREAQSDLDYIQKAQKQASVYYNSAQYYLKKKDYAAVVEYLSRSLGLNPENPNAYYTLAQIYESQKDYLQSIENYKKYSTMISDTKEKSKIDKKIKQLLRLEQKV